MFVKEYFFLNDETYNLIHEMAPEFGYEGFGESVYYRTYSRRKPKDSWEATFPETNHLGELNWSGQERWADTVIRCINGCLSIRYDWYVKNNIHWDHEFWQDYGRMMAVSLFKLYWTPPGRGLWAMGTQFVYERGSMALNNCGFTELDGNAKLSYDFEWMMDALMMGVGVGFHARRDRLDYVGPKGTFVYDIPDTREGWAISTRFLVAAYTLGGPLPRLNYSYIRKKGLPIRGFGGLSSGPEPLIKLHEQIKELFGRYKHNELDVVRLKTDIANLIGLCVVAGNVRRSAELGMGSIQDEVFLNLKNYDLYPERAAHGWMSNNTVFCKDDVDFDKLGEVAKRVPLRGEPGIANWRNFPKGRIGKKNKGLRKDKARGLNPCGEIPLEDKELCNLSETCPTRCPNIETWLQACEYASTYSSTVSLLPTHWPNTNNVVARNRRIGVGIVDYTGWIARDGLFKVTKALRRGYKVVTEANKIANGEAGVPEGIRKTTIKPGGTVPRLVGRTSGAGYPTFDYILRRVRVASNNPVVPLFRAAGVPEEVCLFDPGTSVFGFPVKSVGAKSAEKVSLWEQANNLITLQREWSDNAVSNTLYFKPKWVLQGSYPDINELFGAIDELGRVPELLFTVDEIANVKDGEWSLGGLRVTKIDGLFKLYTFNPNHEEDDIEPVLASILPLIKACSLLPHTPNGVYKQMPEEGISEQEYLRLKSSIRPIDWSTFSGSDGEDEKYCQGGACEIPWSKKE